MRMSSISSHYIVQEMKGLLSVYDACNDLTGKLTDLLALAYHHLSSGQFLDALAFFRQVFSSLYPLQERRSDDFLEILTCAAGGLATSLRFLGYLDVSCYYYLEGIQASLKLGRFQTTLNNYFHLSVLQDHGPIPHDMQHKVSVLRDRMRTVDLLHEKMTKVDILVNLMREKSKFLSCKGRLDKKWRIHQEDALNALMTKCKIVLEDDTLDKDIGNMARISYLELLLLQRMQNCCKDEFIPVDDLVDLAIQLQHHASHDFQRSQFHLLTSKVLLLGGKVEESFDYFGKAVLHSRKIGFRDFLKLTADELECLRNAVHHIAMSSRPSRSLMLKILQLIRLFQFTWSIEAGPIASYLRRLEPLSKKRASCFTKNLFRSR